MDPTLRAILSELYGVSVEVDRLRTRVAELEAQLAQGPLAGAVPLPQIRNAQPEPVHGATLDGTRY